MRISTSKSKAVVLNLKRVYCLHQARDQSLPEVKRFKYLQVLPSGGKNGAEDGLVWCVVRSEAVYLLVNMCSTFMYVPQDVVVIKRKRSEIQAVEMSIL